MRSSRIIPIEEPVKLTIVPETQKLSRFPEGELTEIC